MSAGNAEGNLHTAWQQYIIRAFRLETPGLIAGKTVAEAEANANGRLFLENLRRDGKIIAFDENTVLQVGDIVAVSGKHEALVEWASRATEVSDAELLNIPIEVVDVYVASSRADGKTLIDLANSSVARGIYVTRIRRGSMGWTFPYWLRPSSTAAILSAFVARKSMWMRSPKSLVMPTVPPM